MRDLLNDLADDAAQNPVERARALSKRELPKRFYKSVAVASGDGEGAEAHAILLDGRPVRTKARNTLAVGHADLARRIAAEWEAQAKEIDPATMPLTRITQTAIDAVAQQAGEVADDVVAYAGNDLLVYRAEAPQELVERQDALWGPVIARAEARFTGRFVLAGGIMPVSQDAAMLARIRASLEGTSALYLTALHVATTITGSALLALALGEAEMDVDAVWEAACVDEDWNIAQWGLDGEAEQLRAVRRADLGAAALILDACRGRAID
jgi:chaperone required for assembly of F1-ATPase|uniref:ATP12 family chaperone protein n=1 Tax=Stappia sp. TaxID=1870903 RepID=UPI003BA9CED9